MRNKQLLRAAGFAFIVFMVAVLAWLTLDEPEDPCANPQADIGAAVLAEDAGDQEALVNRAIIMRGNCEEKEQEKDQ